MILDDIKDKVLSESRAISERIQETSTYSQLKDNFENLTPAKQKIVKVFTVVLVLLLVLMVPYSYYTSSSSYETVFLEKRAIIRELLKVTRESKEAPDLSVPPALDILKGAIENKIKAQNLIPEQIKPIEVLEANSKLVPKALASGALKVNLAKLNLRQIVDMLSELQSINSSVKVVDVSIEANRSDSRYFDLAAKLVSLAVPDMTTPVLMPEIEEPKKKSKKKKATNDE